MTFPSLIRFTLSIWLILSLTNSFVQSNSTKQSLDDRESLEEFNENQLNQQENQPNKEAWKSYVPPEYRDYIPSHPNEHERESHRAKHARSTDHSTDDRPHHDRDHERDHHRSKKEKGADHRRGHHADDSDRGRHRDDEDRHHSSKRESKRLAEIDAANDWEFNQMGDESQEEFDRLQSNSKLNESTRIELMALLFVALSIASYLIYFIATRVKIWLIRSRYSQIGSVDHSNKPVEWEDNDERIAINQSRA